MFSPFEALFCFFMLIILCCPFIPGWFELFKPRDNDPLHIDLNSSSDPRQAALTLVNQMKEKAVNNDSSMEILNDSQTINKNLSHSLFAPKKLVFSQEMKLKAMAFAKEEIVVEEKCQIDSLAGEDRIHLKENVTIKRFVDTSKELHVAKNCHLGDLASAAEAIHLHPKCQFKRLYAPKITFVEEPLEFSQREPIPVLSPIDIGRFGWYFNKSKVIIPAESHIKHNIYSQQNLRVRHNVVIDGSLQCQGSVTLSEGVVVKGNIFAKNTILIGRNCKILGNIFSQRSVVIDAGTVVGEFGKIKSVIGKLKIKLHAGITIHGYVMTEGKGYVV